MSEAGKGANKGKIGVFALASMYIAYCCSCTSIPNGGVIGEGSSFGTGLAGMLLGWAIGSVIVIGTTSVTYKSNTFKDVVWLEIFGKGGSRICSFLMAFCMGFWATFDFYNGGVSLHNLMPDGSFTKNLGFCIAVVALVAITIAGGVKGTDGVKIISTLTVPVAAILFVVIYVASVNYAGGMEALMAYQPPQASISVIGAAQIMVGMWMGGFCGIMDLAPGAKNQKTVVFASVAGVGFILLTFLVGQVGFIGTGWKNLGDICMALGGGIFIVGNIFVLVAQANTTPPCNLMYSNSLGHVFSRPRKMFAIFVPMIAGVLAFVIMYGPGVDFINTITSVVSTLMGPLVAVTIADFWIVRKRTFEFSPADKVPLFRPAAVLSLIVGIAVSFALSAASVDGATFITVIVVAVLYVILKKGVKMK